MQRSIENAITFDWRQNRTRIYQHHKLQTKLKRQWRKRWCTHHITMCNDTWIIQIRIVTWVISFINLLNSRRVTTYAKKPIIMHILIKNVKRTTLTQCIHTLPTNTMHEHAILSRLRFQLFVVMHDDSSYFGWVFEYIYIQWSVENGRSFVSWLMNSVCCLPFVCVWFNDNDLAWRRKKVTFEQFMGRNAKRSEYTHAHSVLSILEADNGNEK